MSVQLTQNEASRAVKWAHSVDLGARYALHPLEFQAHFFEDLMNAYTIERITALGDTSNPRVQTILEQFQGKALSPLGTPVGPRRDTTAIGSVG